VGIAIGWPPLVGRNTSVPRLSHQLIGEGNNTCSLLNLDNATRHHVDAVNRPFGMTAVQKTARVGGLESRTRLNNLDSDGMRGCGTLVLAGVKNPAGLWAYSTGVIDLRNMLALSSARTMSNSTQTASDSLAFGDCQGTWESANQDEPKPHGLYSNTTRTRQVNVPELSQLREARILSSY
jgi:hypothetical protein